MAVPSSTAASRRSARGARCRRGLAQQYCPRCSQRSNSCCSKHWLTDCMLCRAENRSLFRSSSPYSQLLTYTRKQARRTAAAQRPQHTNGGRHSVNGSCARTSQSRHSLARTTLEPWTTVGIHIALVSKQEIFSNDISRLKPNKSVQEASV